MPCAIRFCQSGDLGTTGIRPIVGRKPTSAEVCWKAHGAGEVGAVRYRYHSKGDAAAEPPLEPPLVMSGSYGLQVGPRSSLSVIAP